MLLHHCRAVLAAAVAAGFVFLTTTAWAQKSLDVTIKGKDNRSYRAKLYVPNAAGPAPGVLVLHTMGGFIAGEAENSDRAYGQALAKEGFVALVPDYAHANLKDKPHQPAINDDLVAMAKWLAARPEVGGKPLGIVGFSIGASYAVRVAAEEPAVKAIVGYYGLYNFKTQAALKGRSVPPGPTEIASKVNVPMLVLHGSADDETKLDQANDIKAALEKAGKRVELVVYPGAYHRFDRGPTAKMQGEKSPAGHTYRTDAKARDDAWKRTVTFFKEQLK